MYFIAQKLQWLFDIDICRSCVFVANLNIDEADIWNTMQEKYKKFIVLSVMHACGILIHVHPKTVKYIVWFSNLLTKIFLNLMISFS